MEKRFVALAFGVATHLLFLAAVTVMFVGLYSGMLQPGGHFSWGRLVWDLALLLNFPVIHSLLLTKVGRKIMTIGGRSKTAGHLSTTTFVLFSSLQLLLVFLCWKSTNLVIWHAPPFARDVAALAFIGSWLMLGKSMWDSDLTLQTGLKGWLAVFRGNRPEYRGFSRSGLYRFCRQPIYLSFLLILLTGPYWTVDRLLIAAVWGSYCYLGALAKERRFARVFGDEFLSYQKEVPFFFPIPRLGHSGFGRHHTVP